MRVSKRLKQIYILFLATAILACIHGILNLIYDKQEWISLGFLGIAAVILMFAFMYSIMEFAITKEPSDLWKVGFLGIFGLIGLIPGVGYGFFGLFGLFGFFGTRQYF